MAQRRSERPHKETCGDLPLCTQGSGALRRSSVEFLRSNVNLSETAMAFSTERSCMSPSRTPSFAMSCIAGLALVLA